MSAPSEPPTSPSHAQQPSGDLGATLLKWVNTFPELTGKCQNVAGLSNGVQLFELLSILAPAHFDMDDVTKDTGTNAVLATSNVTKLLHGLEAFFEDVFEKKVDLSYISANAIAKERNTGEIVKVLELVIMCAIPALPIDLRWCFSSGREQGSEMTSHRQYMYCVLKPS